MPGTKSTAQLNQVPPKTGDAVKDAKPMAKAEDKLKESGAKAAKGKTPLEGEELAKFKKVYEGSALIRGMFNADGTPKD
ncbi:MAG: hypothetical protein GOVbin2277_33 [Prokaryotic dsDNA virus sp.]|jgi:hypothetical protein|nr:MAG: hypothetical protein GOVbin2277_33 [Prokaryotic dsDNA virus sp.]|tara:strand:+ start:624 stop:860 length:237 start_codon:yes stop_codon:yes gene_type:complete